MSSSRFSPKIIKSDRLCDVRVSSVRYGGLQGDDAEGGGLAAPRSFMPLQLGETTAVHQEDAADNAPQAEVPLDPGTVLIVEEELQQKLTEAYRKGMDEGRQQAERGLANVFRSLREAVEDVTRLRDKVLRDSEEDLLKLTIMVARKIIQQEISHDPQILANIIAETISCCSDNDRITVRLNPDDCSVVSENRHFYLAGIDANTHVSLIPDESILPGGCMVDTVTGTIDARIEVQLDEIYRRFQETRGTLEGEPSAAAGEIMP